MEENNLSIPTKKIETADEYEIQSELNDMKQHANKIIQGIKKLDNNDASRAIWELFQNAVDLSEECHVHIKLTDSTFEFSHNGEPFTPMTLDCLFKQVSSKTLEEKKLLYNENDPVGQYGTGFITTHAFGKELIIKGALIKGDGYVPLNQFVINRHTDNWKELAVRIRELKKEVASLLNIGQIHPTPYPTTTFTYKTSTKHNQVCAIEALASLRLILPYVMTLNSKLKSVIVSDINGVETVYKKEESYSKGSIQIRPISVNGIDQEICYLQSEQENVTIILPLTSDFKAFDFDENLPRLFLYYPLIGTQHLGINYIINSRQFQPTEPRNSLYLKSDNDSNEKDEEVNRTLLQKASEIIFQFVQENSSKINNTIKLATIKFNTTSDDVHLNEYFGGLKTKWINEFKNYPIVETDDGNLKPSETFFLHDELLLEDKYFDAVFDLANMFWKNIPKKYLIKEWTEKIVEWNIDEIKYIKIKDIVEKIQALVNFSAFENHDNLKQFYLYIISQNKTGLFNEYKLLPNINGEFRHWSGNEGLNSSLNLTKELIEIAEVIMPDIPKRHVHPDFKFNLEFTDYSRKNYTTDINENIGKQLGEKATSETIPKQFLEKLMEYCKITSSAESISVPNKMMKLICKYYQQNEESVVIPIVKEDELDIRSPQRRLLKLFLNDIGRLESNWVIDNINFLKDIIATGANYDAYEELFQTLAVFPSQLNELTEQRYLSIDDNIPTEIKDLYDRVVKPDFPIRSNLVDSNFAEYLKIKQKKTVRDLTEKIESKFFDDAIHFSINDHEFKKEILGIIEKIKSTSFYEKYYPLIYSKRSGILVDLADGVDTFSILSLDPSRINKLAELANNPDFEKIIQEGEKALIKQHQDTSKILHKQFIGNLVEKIIRERLSHIVGLNKKDSNENVDPNNGIQTKEEQNGQDIIIYLKNEPIYFIEVKSRWNETTPFRISRNQTIKAFNNKENYSLVSVDMTQSLLQNKYLIKDISEIKAVIKVNTDVGKKIDGDLVNLYNGSKQDDTFHLDGDFRTYIPFGYIEEGKTIDEFEEYLIDEIQKIYAKQN